MGLITSVNDISKAIESEKKQKQREKQQKELEKIRQTKLKRELTKYFESKYKKSIDYDQMTYELIKNKTLIIDILKDNYIKKYNLNGLDTNTNAILNDEYIKLLNRAKKPYLEMQRIEQKQQKELIKQYKEAEKMQKEIRKQQENNNIKQYKILETFIIIILLPLILVLGIIKGLLQR